MGCNKKKIFNIEDRLSEIQKRKTQILRIIAARRDPEENLPKRSEIKLANSKQYNVIYRDSDGRVRRLIMLRGDNTIVPDTRINTINGQPDGVDPTRISDPRLQNGDILSVELVENDYWKNNKWQYPKDEHWKHVPLYLVNKDGEYVEMLEAVKSHRIPETLIREQIYDALIADKKVEVEIAGRTHNFNNTTLNGAPIFLDVKENLSPRFLKNTDGDISVVDNIRPILTIATGVPQGSPTWSKGLESVSDLDPNVIEAMAQDLGADQRIPKEDTIGQVAAVVLTPEGKYTIAKLSTRNLSDKAVNYILDALNTQDKNKIANINKLVGNNLMLEKAHSAPKPGRPGFLNIETVPNKDGSSTTFINFYSKKHDTAIRLTAAEFSKAVKKEEFMFNTGRFVQVGKNKAGLPQFRWKTTKIITDKGLGEMHPIVGELEDLLKLKKHEVDVNFLNSMEKFEIPGFTKRGGYASYQDYLFDPEAHGESFGIQTDMVNNTAIINTDIMNMGGSIFFNTHMTFNDLLVDGKTVLKSDENITAGPAMTPGDTSKSAPGPDLGRRYSIDRDYISQPKVDQDKAKAWLDERFGVGSTTILEGVNKVGNLTRHGYFENMAFFLADNAKVGTEYHEGYHGMFRMWLNDKQRQSLYKEARQKYGIPTDQEIKEINDIREELGQERLSVKEAEELVLEEKMAEEFSEYMLTDGQSTPGGIIGKFFRDIWNFIKAIISDNISIKQSYEMLESNIIPSILKRNIQRFKPTDRANSIEGYTEENLKDATDELISRYIKYSDEIQATIDEKRAKGEKAKPLNTKNLLRSIKNSFLRDSFTDLDGKPLSNDSETLEILKEYFSIKYEGQEGNAARLLKINNIKEGSPQGIEGHPIQDNSPYYLDIYSNWNDTIEGESEMANVRSRGFLTLMGDRFKNYGLKMKLGEATIQEADEQDKEVHERIYSKARVQEDMRSKVNEKIRKFLATIKSDEISYLGFQRYIPFEVVYADLQKELAGSESFAEMMVRLNKKGKIKPHISKVYDEIYKIENESERNNMMSSFYFTFALHHNKFLLFKETSDGLIIMDANRNSIETRVMDQWRNNITQKPGALNPRHLYGIKQTEDGLIYILNKNNIKKVEQSWSVMQEIHNVNPKQPVPPRLVRALGDFLYSIGVDVSDDIRLVDAILTEYLEEGTIKFSPSKSSLKGVALYKAIMDNGTNKQLSRVKDGLIRGENIYKEYGSIISKFADIALRSKTDMFGSFLNSKNNSIFPINLTTVIDDMILNLQGRNPEFFTPYYKDPFFNPMEGIKELQALYLRLYNDKDKRGIKSFTIKARQELINTTLDSYKKLNGRAFEYNETSETQSLLLRMAAFINPGGKAGYTNIVPPTFGDRQLMEFLNVPTVEKMMKMFNMTEEDIIKAIIIQDLMRAKQAKSDMALVEDGGLPTNRLIKDFHYNPDAMAELGITDPRDPNLTYEEKIAIQGNAFKMNQFTVVEDTVLKDNWVGDEEFKLSDVNWDDYFNEKPLVINRELVETALNEAVQKVQTFITEDAIATQEKYIEQKLVKNKSVGNLTNPYKTLNELFRAFTLNNLIHGIEIKKWSRGGISFNKSYIDFSKRFDSMGTPGYKLLLKGDLGKDSNWGFYEKFNEGLMEDFFTTPEVYDAIGASITTLLNEQNDPDAINIGNLFKGGQSNKSDAFGVISIDTYRAFLEGKGQWTPEHKDAYQRYKKGGTFTNNYGKHMRVEPIKQYYDKLVYIDGRMVPQTTKNSYMVLLREYTKTNPTAELIRQRLENEGQFAELDPIHVMNTVTTKKLAKIGVEDLSSNTAEKLANMTYVTLDGDGFRIPQIIPEKKKGKKGLLGRQFMMNIIAGMDLNSTELSYILNEDRINQRTLTGKQVFDLYHSALVDMIDKSYNELMGELGYNDWLKSQVKSTRSEKKTSKINFLKNIRSALETEIKDRELPDNYLKAISIVEDEKGNPRFAFPLAFPNLKRKFEGIMMGMLKKRIIKQKMNGGSAKQIAELGGHITIDEAGISDLTELKFVRYENGKIKSAEVAIRADIAAQYGLKPGDDLSTIPEELRTIVGYRIPNQGKNSMIPLVIKYVLPANYDQAIVVPGGITTQQGSDFDIDPLYLLMPNTQKNKQTGIQEKLKVNYNKLFDKNGEIVPSELVKLGRPALENIIIDVSESILKSKSHFKELVIPLDSPDMANIANYMKTTLELEAEFDPNSSLTETKIEMMNKDGVAGIGMYAVTSTGKNIAQYTNLTILGATPIINGVNYNDPSILFDNKSRARDELGMSIAYNENGEPVDREDELIEYIISKRISSSVDNAINPDMFFRNDNDFTWPVHALFDAVGINEFTTHNFMNQPIIRLLTKVYKDQGLTPNRILDAVRETVKQWNKSIDQVEQTDEQWAELYEYLSTPVNVALEMIDEDLIDISMNPENIDRQIDYLKNFVAFHRSGRGLLKAYKVLNQDKGADKGSFGGLLSFRDTEQSLLEEKVVSGVEGAIARHDYPLQKAFSQAIDRMLSFGGEFFIHSKEGVRVTKEQIRVLLNKNDLTERDHRNIEEAMLLWMMSKPESPLSEVLTESSIRKLLVNPNTSLPVQLEALKNKYPLLKNNTFIDNVVEHPENLKEDSLLNRIRFQNLYSFSAFEVNSFVDGLKNLYFKPELYTEDKIEQEEIKQLALNFLKVSILTHGYTPGHDSFIDLIPVEMLGRSSNFFYEEMEKLNQLDYFDNDFVHNFIRNFYYTDIVPNIRVKDANVKNILQINEKDNRIYSITHGKPVAYFTVNTKDGRKLFVLSDVTKGTTIYEKSSVLGIPFGLKELRIYDEEGNTKKKSIFISNKGSDVRPELTKSQNKWITERIAREDQQAELKCI